MFKIASCKPQLSLNFCFAKSKKHKEVSKMCVFVRLCQSVGFLGPRHVVRSRFLSRQALDHPLHPPPEAQLIQGIVTPALVKGMMGTVGGWRREGMGKRCEFDGTRQRQKQLELCPVKTLLNTHLAYKIT